MLSSSSKGGHFLISLEERHARNVLNGTKSIELRRRRMHVSVGSTVWIYAKLPQGEVVGSAKVSDVHCLSPETIWRRYSDRIGISRNEFLAYFTGLSKAFALGLSEAHSLRNPIPLKALRLHKATFQPPQFYMRLSPDSFILRAARADSASSSTSIKKRIGIGECEHSART